MQASLDANTVTHTVSDVLLPKLEERMQKDENNSENLRVSFEAHVKIL